MSAPMSRRALRAQGREPRHNLRPVAGCLWFPAPWLSRSGVVLSEQRNPRRPERLSRWRCYLPTIDLARGVPCNKGCIGSTTIR
jgi:hypothetical protein